MVLVMESDGSLTPSRSQSSFARNYNEGIGQSSASDGIAIFGEVEAEQRASSRGPCPPDSPAPRRCPLRDSDHGRGNRGHGDALDQRRGMFLRTRDLDPLRTVARIDVRDGRVVARDIKARES